MNNVVICAMAKHENDYINDWINYHIELGFDHIYIFDNNESDYEPIEFRIEQLDKTTIFKVPERVAECLQTYCYDKFYAEYNKTFNWCAFIDIDEYITLEDWSNINEFLNDPKFKDYPCVRLNMTCIGDDGLIERDMSIPLHKALFGRCNIDWLDFGGKQIVKGNMNGITFGAHCPYQNGEIIPNQITPSGKVGQFGNRIDERNNNAYIRHYRTKTLSEFVKQKLGRSDVVDPHATTKLNYFFESNDRTKEKDKWLSDHNIVG